MKIILSTFGPLHLIKGSIYISEYVDLSIIQGWLPGKKSGWLVDILSRIMHRNLKKSFQKRINHHAKDNIGIAIPEFYLWLGKLFPKLGLTNIKAAEMYGRASRKYLHDADIFHVRAGNGQGGAIETAKKNGMKVIVDQSIAHNAFIEKQLKQDYEKYGLDFGFSSTFWKGVLNDCNKADLLLVNSDFVKQTFIDEGYDAGKIEVVYLGVRDDFYKLKTDYSIKGTTKILFTGGFGFRKGGLYLLQALQQLESENFDYEMYIVGSYQDEREILQNYDTSKIRYIGFIPQDELKHYLSQSDIYIFPSLAEGCASSGMEALCAGIPVIATQESGLPIQHLETGYIIPSKSSKAIVQAIKDVATDRILRERIGTRAADMIREKYTWEKYAELVVNSYKKVLHT